MSHGSCHVRVEICGWLNYLKEKHVYGQFQTLTATLGHLTSIKNPWTKLVFQVVLLMEEILHQLIGSKSYYLQGFTLYARWLAWFLPSTVLLFRVGVPKKGQFQLFSESPWRVRSCHVMSWNFTSPQKTGSEEICTSFPKFPNTLWEGMWTPKTYPKRPFEQVFGRLGFV